MNFQEMLEKYQVKCTCGGSPVKMRTPKTPSNYFHIECNSCYKGTCTDTNEVVIWQSWASGRNTLDWYEY